MILLTASLLLAALATLAVVLLKIALQPSSHGAQANTAGPSQGIDPLMSRRPGSPSVQRRTDPRTFTVMSQTPGACPHPKRTPGVRTEGNNNHDNG